MKAPALLTSLLTIALFSPLISPSAAQDVSKDKDKIEKRKTVYVPYDKLDEIFEKNDRGIYMSYKEFLELLSKANKKQIVQRPKIDRPPADWVLVSAGYGGEVSNKVARFSGVFAIEVLKKKGWIEVPLGIDNIAFSRVRVRNKDAIVRRRPSSKGRPAGYTLLMQGEGSLKVETDFVVPINDKTPGERSFTFRLPEAAISSFKVRLPEKGLRVEVSQSLSVKTEDDGDQTVVTAYLKSGGNITVRWWPRPKEVKGQKALLYADTTTVMRIEEGVVRTATKVLYRIHQASAQQFDISFPKEYKILSVTGKNIEGWVPKGNGAGLSVKLRSPVERSYDLMFRLERIVPDITQKLVFPPIHTVNTEREVGTACVIGSKLLKLKVGQLEGATQITKKKDQLPRDLTKDTNLASYGAPLAFHTKKAFNLSIKATRVEPEVNGHVTTLATVRDNEIGIRTVIRYLVKRRGIFSVKVKLPKSFSLLECGNEATVKDYRIDSGVLEIEFPNQVLARPYELLITGQIPRKKGAGKIDFPVFQLMGVKKETGHLAVASVKHLELTTEKSLGLVAINRAQMISKGFVQQHSGQVSKRMRLPVDIRKEELTLAFKYAKPGGQAEIGVKKRDPKIDADVRVLANADEDLLKVEGTVHYVIKYAGVDIFKLKVPNAIADGFKIEGQSIKEKSPKKGDDFTVFTVKTQSKQLNKYQLKFRYEIKFADLKPGAETEVTVHPVRVLEVANERGSLALVKHENLVIREVPGTRSGLENRDVAELPQSLKQAKVFRAYRTQGGDYSLQLRIIKYDFKAPLGTLINHLHLDEVITNEGTCQTEAWILLQNSTEQFLRVRLPKKTVVQGLRVAGTNKQWSQAQAGSEFNEILINLASHSGKTEPFLIRLRYDVPATSQNAIGLRGHVALVTPNFPLRKGEEVPVTHFTRQVVFGPDVLTLDFQTDMTRHFEADPGFWNDLKSFVFTPMGRQRRVGSVIMAIQALKQKDQIGRGAGGLYYELKNAELIRVREGRGLSRLSKMRLFSKLNGSAELSVGYMSWILRDTLVALIFVLIVVAGFVVERKKLVSAVAFFGVSTTATLVLWTFTEGTTALVMRGAFLGGSMLGAVWLVRGVWREMTVERQKRLIEVLEAETQVARARAAAAEVQSRAQSSNNSGSKNTAPMPVANLKVTEVTQSSERPLATPKNLKDLPDIEVKDSSPDSSAKDENPDKKVDEKSADAKAEKESDSKTGKNASGKKGD
jgi:hypothetical protein